MNRLVTPSFPEYAVGCSQLHRASGFVTMNVIPASSSAPHKTQRGWGKHTSVKMTGAVIGKWVQKAGQGQSSMARGTDE